MWVKVGFTKCESLPTFKIKIGNNHQTRLPFDSGASHFCTIQTSLLEKWEKADKDFKAGQNIDALAVLTVTIDETQYKILSNSVSTKMVGLLTVTFGANGSVFRVCPKFCVNAEMRCK